MFANEVSFKAQRMGVDDALGRMKKALTEAQPGLSWEDVMAKYKALADVEDAAILGELGIGLSEDESENAEEGANPTEVGRSEELTWSTNDQTDPPPS